MLLLNRQNWCFTLSCQNFLTKGTGNIASYAEIEDTINAAFILEINGVTEDELLLYEIDSQKAVANGISESAATSEWAVDFVNKGRKNGWSFK